MMNITEPILNNKRESGKSRRQHPRRHAKKLVWWMALIPVAVLLLIILIVKLDTADNYISRAMASKAMALTLADKEGISASQKTNGSYFPADEKEQWYTKYIDYLLERDLFEGEVKAGKNFAEDALTYGEAAYAAEQLSPGLSQALNVSKKKYKKPMPKKEWWLFYETFLKKVDTEHAVDSENLLLYGTPANVKEAAPWTAYTDSGILGFEGISLDAYLDHEIKAYVRGNEIIHMTEDISDEVVYKNIWMMPGGKNTMNLYVGAIIREFPMEEVLEEEKDGALADVTLKKGHISKVALKKDTIEGKVLSVKEDSIEIEGYGTLKLDPDFKVYKTYGVVKELRKKDILVGYDLQKFVVTGKKVCAALQVKSFSAKNIRVLVMNNGFKTLFHNEIRLKAETPLHITYGTEENGVKEEIVEAGRELVIKKDDARLNEGRMTIEPEDKRLGIQVTSIERMQGIPAYFGCFEISRESEGLLLLNELDVEDYLTRVVPSEMPPSYELEALKAQAVCARTYAYRQIQANYYSKYGAHVDDSTNYQVYNNTDASERTDMAVKETYGEMVFLNDTPVETYYFSTSCGHTTDGTIWGADLADVPYLKGIPLTEERTAMDLTTNDAFIPFIKGEGIKTYDSGYAMYRWTTTFTNKELAAKIDNIGMIQAVMVTARGTGGIAKTVKVIGSEGEKTLSGQSQIRSVLGDESLVYKKKDGDTLTGWSTLPSAFIAVDETARDEEKGIRTFTIWGGGYGHGVGMSQNGAQAMAKDGKSYKDILTYFFDGVEVKELEP